MNYIEARSIAKAWREVMWLCLESDTSYIQEIKNANVGKEEFGSYIGQYRLQLPYVTIHITHPWEKEPFTPENSTFKPTDDYAIGQYFAEYLLNPELQPNEIYRYSSWIAPQLPDVIRALITSNGGTNQATISVGDSTCPKMSDPPCLRLIDFKVVNKELWVSVIFRSWDLVCGLPENLSGIQLLKEYVLDSVNNHLNEKLTDGHMIAYSSGLHIYSQYFDIVKSLNFCSEKALKRMEGIK